jgi:acyl phosphate:glycerol-3-phosphate acyltransferase
VEWNLLSIIVGYAIGSIPTAYVVVRWKSRIDIRAAGSQNVGALNSYEVTGSKGVALMVLCADLAKGAIAVWAVSLLPDADFSTAATGAVAAVVGHNYPVWLTFHGGRGLAPAAGASSLVCWPLVPFWMALWQGGYLLTRDLNAASAVGSILTIVLVSFLPGDWIGALLPGVYPEAVRAYVVVLMVVILLRLFQPVRQYIETLRKPGSYP